MQKLKSQETKEKLNHEINTNLKRNPENNDNVEQQKP